MVINAVKTGPLMLGMNKSSPTAVEDSLILKGSSFPLSKYSELLLKIVYPLRASKYPLGDSFASRLRSLISLLEQGLRTQPFSQSRSLHVMSTRSSVGKLHAQMEAAKERPD